MKSVVGKYIPLVFLAMLLCVGMYKPSKMAIMSNNSGGQLNTLRELPNPLYASWWQQDIAPGDAVDYDTIAKNDVGDLHIAAMDEPYGEGAYAGLVDSVRTRNPDYVNLIYISAVGAVESWATLPIGSYRHDVYKMIDRIDDRLYSGRSGTKPYGAWLRDTSGTITLGYQTGYNIRNINPYAAADGLADSLAVCIVDHLRELTNDKQYTGLFLDFLDVNYANWRCRAPGCDDSIDMDGDGVPYRDTVTSPPVDIYDDNEVAEMQVYNHQLLSTIRSEFAGHKMKNRLIVCNGDYTYETAGEADLVDGTVFENVGDQSGDSSDSRYKGIVGDDSNAYQNADTHPRLVIVASDTTEDSGKWLVPIALAAQGGAMVQSPATGKYGDSGPFGLDETDKVHNAGTFVSSEYLDYNEDSTDSDGDVIHTTYSNLEAWSKLKATTNIPFPYLVLSTVGDTLSVGGGWRNMPKYLSGEYAPSTLSFHSGTFSFDKLVDIKYRAGHSTGVIWSKMTWDAWSSYTGSYSTDKVVFDSYALSTGQWCGVEIIAKDSDGNETLKMGYDEDNVKYAGFRFKVNDNLLADSWQFNSTYWKGPTTYVDITEGQTDPFGGNTACLYEANASSAYFQESTISVNGLITGGLMCNSIYVKKGTSDDRVEIRAYYAFTDVDGVKQMAVAGGSWSGTVLTFDGYSNFYGSSVVDGGVIDAGSGWYRLYVVYDTSRWTTSNTMIERFVVFGSGSPTGNTYFGDYKVEEWNGAAPTLYIEKP